MIRDLITRIRFSTPSLLQRDVAVKFDFHLESRNLQRHFCGKCFCACNGRIVQKKNRHSSGCDPMVVAEHSAEALSAPTGRTPVTAIGEPELILPRALRRRKCNRACL
jgi:hypothetical protein